MWGQVKISVRTECRSVGTGQNFDLNTFLITFLSNVMLYSPSL